MKTEFNKWERLLLQQKVKNEFKSTFRKLKDIWLEEIRCGFYDKISDEISDELLFEFQQPEFLTLQIEIGNIFDDLR